MPPSNIWTPSGRGLEFISKTIISSAVATVNLLGFANPAIYNFYRLYLNGLTAGIASGINARGSGDGGATWLSGVGAYGNACYDHYSASSYYNSNATAWDLNVTNNGVTTTGLQGYIDFFPGDGNTVPWIAGKSVMLGSSQNVASEFSGFYGNTAQIMNALQLYFTGGNTTSGNISIYGVRK